MDFERAKAFANEIGGVRNQAQNLEPITPVEGLSPEERFSSAAKRIEALSLTPPLVTDDGFFRSVELAWPIDGLFLALNSMHTVRDRQPVQLLEIRETWKFGETVISEQRVWHENLADQATTRLLGLIEESLTVAEQAPENNRFALLRAMS